MNAIHPSARIRYLPLLAVASLFALGYASAGASDPASASSLKTLIETRKASLKKMGAAMKTIVDQLKTDAPDHVKMTAAAEVISVYAQELPRWFPDGSGSEAGVETDALPYIWKDRVKFDSLANRLAPESKNLTTAIANNDPAALKVQVKVVSELCSTCHHSFRAD